MFHSPGANAAELGDIDVIEADGVLHLFHLVLPNHDLVAHATSTDGLHWTPAPVALRTGDPGEYDDDQIWTMQTVRKPDGSGFRMYYTACSTREHGQVQRVAIAESADLNTWTKSPHNPVLESKNPHYNEDISLVGFVSFRDPFVFLEDGTWHMLVTARENHGPRFRRGCIAHATSPDGLRWTLQPPLYAPQSYEDLETPALLRLAGRYYLFFNDFGLGQTPYRIAESLAGPWRAPERDILLPPLNSVFRFCRWQGKLLAYHWLRAEADWHSRSGQYAALAPPKELEVNADGTLRLVSFGGWASRFHGAPQQLTHHDFCERSGPNAQWEQAENGGLSVQVNGMATARAARPYDDFIAEFEVQMEQGQACGMAFRCDEPFEIANWLRLDFSRQTVELHRSLYFDSALHRYKLKKPSLVQSAPCELRHGESVRVRVLACREYIEVSLNGAVYLSAATYKTQRGQLALYVEEGEAKFSPLHVQPLTSQ